jgi:peptidyl-dipeptidase A
LLYVINYSYREFAELTNKLNSIYASAKVCEDGQCMSLEPEISKLMKNSRDYDVLLRAWKGWHEQSGGKMREIFKKTVDIQNKAAVENGYKDLSEYWIADFEDEHFESNMDKLFEQIKPFYQQLHAYVRRKLNNFYGDKYPANHNPKLIPAHLLGNMWAQTWDNIYDMVKPYPNVKDFNLTSILIEKNFTPIKMFKKSEEFFTSIGLYEMSPTFWKESMIEKPSNKTVQCHASAFDFLNGFDFR